MKAFANLFSRLDETTKTSEKTEALVEYFNSVPASDAAWAIYFLSGRKPRRLIKSSLLREWASSESGIPLWLFEESYDAVGDLAETIALVLPENSASSEQPLHVVIEELLLPLRDADEDEKKATICKIWGEMDAQQRFLFNKLLTGEFRVGVSQRLVTRAVGESSGIDPKVIAHRLMGNWIPSEEFYKQLVAQDTDDSDSSKPYPFYLAHPLDGEVDALGEPEEWSAEWKWDGIRAQVIRRGDSTYIWSRGEELVTEQFPELEEAARDLPDGTVLDGEILCWDHSEGTVMAFSQLQKRLGRKKVGAKLLKEAPVVLMTYDLLELGGVDLRERDFSQRRRMLEEVVEGVLNETIKISPCVGFDTWDVLSSQRGFSREMNVEGLMLKRKSSPYGVGRQRGDWWKWKVEPYTVDAVLIYAQRGHGRRASLYTDYTFAVWSGEELVPFAKAYSGLTDEEIWEVDAFVRANTLERFGPVRSVKPELVFELAFEGIQKSSRHKSGIAVRFPRMVRWRRDKVVADADSLAMLASLLLQVGCQAPEAQ